MQCNRSRNFQPDPNRRCNKISWWHHLDSFHFISFNALSWPAKEALNNFYQYIIVVIFVRNLLNLLFKNISTPHMVYFGFDFNNNTFWFSRLMDEHQPHSKYAQMWISIKSEQKITFVSFFLKCDSFNFSLWSVFLTQYRDHDHHCNVCDVCDVCARLPMALRKCSFVGVWIVYISISWNKMHF